MAVADQDHRRIAMAPAASFPSGSHEALDLTTRYVLASSNWRTYDVWCRPTGRQFCHDFPLALVATRELSHFFSPVSTETRSGVAPWTPPPSNLVRAANRAANLPA